MPRLRVATVFHRKPRGRFEPPHMSTVRWLRISEALARRGHDVDMIVGGDAGETEGTPRLRLLPFDDVRWEDYDVVKTLFHQGFESLAKAGGAEHPFIISKLGSVVGRCEQTEGVHFHGEEWRRLLDAQRRIARRSRYVSVLTRPSRDLWCEMSGRDDNALLVPTGVDCSLPPPGEDPYRKFPEKIAVYIGNLYGRAQSDINRLWQRRLNAIGRALWPRGIRLCVVGGGRVDELDPAAATYLGEVPNDRVWDYQRHAHAGLVLAQGPVQHNESSKIYYYLRAGLPVVSERPVPNNHLVETCGLGAIVDYDDTAGMVEAIEEVVHRHWDPDEAVREMLRHHTWDRRSDVYHRLFEREFGRTERS